MIEDSGIQKKDHVVIVVKGDHNDHMIKKLLYFEKYRKVKKEQSDNLFYLCDCFM